MKVIAIIISFIAIQVQADELSVFNHPFGVKIRVIDSFVNQNKSEKDHGLIVTKTISKIEVNYRSTVQYNINLSTEDWVNKEVVDAIERNPANYFSSKESKQEDAKTVSFILALEKAGKDGVKIVNYSVAGEVANAVEQEEIQKILNKYDMILVVSAGNKGKSTKTYPCAYPDSRIICVGSAEYDDSGVLKDAMKIHRFSNRGSHVDFYAYGMVFSEPKIIGGTSFSAPKVSAALALILSNFPNMKPLEAVEFLKKQGKMVSTIQVSEAIEKQTNPLKPFFIHIEDLLD